MSTDAETIQQWFESHMDEEWASEGVEITADEDEILVVTKISSSPEEELPEDSDEKEAALKRNVRQFRKSTRQSRMSIAAQAQEIFERKVSWGAQAGDSTYLFTHVAVPAMTRLRINERSVLDTLVNAGVAGSRSEALAWCVRFVSKNEQNWLSDLRDAFRAVEKVRQDGPSRDNP